MRAAVRSLPVLDRVGMVAHALFWAVLVGWLFLATGIVWLALAVMVLALVFNLLVVYGRYINRVEGRAG